MSETKEMLEATVNKPEITAVQMEVIDEAVRTVLEDYQFDCGMFEYEFNLGYDNKLELSELTFTDAYDLEEAIMINIGKQFKTPKDV